MTMCEVCLAITAGLWVWILLILRKGRQDSPHRLQVRRRQARRQAEFVAWEKLMAKHRRQAF